ncbi:MAG: hypothetical protein L3K10_05125 [Thermoplasmata archaeon]|nr:hypothetical protein [Thermoplasmata archaeon]
MGLAPVTVDEVKIRDLSRPLTSEWTPPIGAMGGPPAHELYRDLVAHGGLRLLRDRDGNPWVEMQDGVRRRSFRVPGTALRGAFDRFRMRRNLRPVPESDLDDFARVVAARISDPDVRLPVFDSSALDRAPPAPEPESSFLDLSSSQGSAPQAPPSALEQELEAVLREVDLVRGAPTLAPLPAPPVAPLPAPPAPALEPPTPTAWREDEPGPVVSDRPLSLPMDASISGGHQDIAAADDSLPRYLRVLRGLVEGGGWIGTLGELGRLTGEEPDVVFGSLLKFHTQLTGNNLVVAPVEVEDGWRWLVVDRSRLHSSPSPLALPEDEIVPTSPDSASLS